MKVVDITPVSTSEICAALRSVRGCSRKVICIAAYHTTALDEDGSVAFLEEISDMIHSFKSKYNDPVVLVAGDWNRAQTGIALDDFPSIHQIMSPPTRGDEVLDITFLNVPRMVSSVVICPLWSRMREGLVVRVTIMCCTSLLTYQKTRNLSGLNTLTENTQKKVM